MKNTGGRITGGKTTGGRTTGARKTAGGRPLSKKKIAESENAHLVKLLDNTPTVPLPNSTLVRSQQQPSGQERLIIEGKITSIERKITAVEASLAKLEQAITRGNTYADTINAAYTRVSSLRECSKHYRSLLSPIRKLPIEILSLIFSYVVDEIDIHESRGPIYKVKKICSHWFNVVNASPTLWRRFNVVTPVLTLSRRAVALRIRRCLELSGEAGPLTIMLRADANDGELESKYFRMCLDSGHKLVEDLTLSRHDDLYVNISTYPGSSWEKLKRLSFDTYKFRTWTSLKALSGMQCLEELSLRNVDVYRDGLALEEMIHLGSLKTLDLEDIASTIYSNAVKRICTPCLVKLRISETLKPYSSDSLDAIRAIIRDSKFSLESFELNIQTTPAIITSLLDCEQLCHIKHLSLGGHSISKDILKRIPTIHGGLETLELNLVEPCEFQWLGEIFKCLYAVVKHYKERLSRSLIEVKLSGLKNHIHRRVYERDLEDLVKYGKEKAGTKVTVEWIKPRLNDGLRMARLFTNLVAGDINLSTFDSRNIRSPTTDL